MCLAPETMMDASPHAHDARDVIDAGDEVFVRAPPTYDPVSPQQVDAVGYRADLHNWADGLRAEAGLRALSAAAYRRRRADDHKCISREFTQRRKVAVGLEDDELCRSVQAALDTEVTGGCAYCGCNFCIVAALEDVWGLGGGGGDRELRLLLCGVCGRRLRKYDPTPLVRNVPADAEERWKGWLPW